MWKSKIDKQILYSIAEEMTDKGIDYMSTESLVRIYLRLERAKKGGEREYED